MNRWMAALATLGLALTLAATATASTVRYDYDRHFDFSNWKRAAWAEPLGPGASLADRRIADALEAGFRARGYGWVAQRAEADFVIAYRTAAWEDVTLGELPRGIGRGRSLYVDREARGALVVDVLERHTGRLVWRGMVADALARDPEQADRRLARAVKALLERFPPRPAR